MEAAARVCAWLEQHGLGGRKVNYKLRDWLFARQARLVTGLACGWQQASRLALLCTVVAFLHHFTSLTCAAPSALLGRAISDCVPGGLQHAGAAYRW